MSFAKELCNVHEKASQYIKLIDSDTKKLFEIADSTPKSDWREWIPTKEYSFDFDYNVHLLTGLYIYAVCTHNYKLDAFLVGGAYNPWDPKLNLVIRHIENIKRHTPNEDCCICLDIGVDPVIVKCCKQSFHRKCIEKLAICPLCRFTKIEFSDEHELESTKYFNKHIKYVKPP